MFDAVLMMGGLGLIIGVGLAAASKIFYVYVDPKIIAVEDALPGANCGGCGQPGCSANAEAIVAGKAAPNSCVAAGEDDIAVIAGIMGVSVAAAEPDIARPGCYFGVQKADTKYLYAGVDDCRAVALFGGGMKICNIGCLGLGTCAKSCPFGAITMGPEGLPVVNEKKCTGCGTCERVCPKHIITLSSITRRILREYTTDECTTPCQRSCPAGINIREYIRQISLGDYYRAVQVIKERNPFPTVIGRICPRPCELDCRRNLVDQPVAINYLKRFAADFERESGQRVQPYKAPATDRKIAIVGGGVEGLSTAFFTARLGHDVTVFEATDRLGGLLRKAIDKERLPMEILEWDIAGVLEMGVNVETGKTLGKDFTAESLFEEGYEAIFLASGGWDSRLMRGAASQIEMPIPGMYLSIDVLRAAEENTGKISCKADTVIAGGGKFALDAAKACKSLGAKNITILLREAELDNPIAPEDLETADLKDVCIVYEAAISKLMGEKDQLTQVESISLYDQQKSVVPAQTLVIAAGRFPEMAFIRPKTDAPEGEAPSETASSLWEGISPYKSPAQIDEAGLFSKGDVLVDYNAAIRAIGAGRRAAVTLHRLINGIDLILPGLVLTPESNIQNVDQLEGVAPSQRQIMPVCSGIDLETCGEVEMGFSEDMARKEAARCLQCGLVCYERSEDKGVQIQSSMAAGA